MQRFQRFSFLRNLNFWGHFLFWSWNTIFILFMTIGFAPNVLPDLIGAIRTGEVPILFPIFGIILTLIPVVITLLGLTKLHDQPRKLLALGYGIEGPLMLLVVIRFFVFRQLPPAVVMLLVMASIGMATLAWQIFDKEIERRGQGLQLVRLLGATVALLVGVYAAVWAALYAIPLAAAIVRAVSSFFFNFGDNMRSFWRNISSAPAEGLAFLPFMLLGMLLVGYTASLLVGLPFAVVTLYTRLWRRAVRGFATARPRQVIAYGLSGVLLALFIGLFVLTNRQPQAAAFELLEDVPTDRDSAEILIDQEESIRAGLLNAYLAPTRYISAEGEVRHAEDMFISTFVLPYVNLYNASPGNIERARLQIAPLMQFYHAVAQPILYKPVRDHEPSESRWQTVTFEEESAESAELYEQFFDRPIADAEREEIVRAARTTWNVEQAATNWQAVDDREVLLVHQEVTIQEDGDIADIELYEVYENQTWQEQEVVYYFSLPENAVITGLWLGDSADKSEAFTHRVSPRGAAQAVYRNEVRRNVDPALLEQLGPRQYRLRAFPVLPVRWDQRANPSAFAPNTVAGEHLHLWMTYRMIGSRELPQLTVKRNVYWNDDSTRLLNNQPMRVADDQWMPPGTPMPLTEQDVDTWRKVDFPNGKTVLVRPLVEFRDVAPPLPEDISLAVVIDRSRSMEMYERDVAAALDYVSLVNGTVDVIMTAGEFHPEEATLLPLADVDAEEILYYGGQHAAELLAQYDELKQREYDAVIVLTDSSGYEQGESPVAIPQPTMPVWMVHFGGFPIGYDDDTLTAIQGSGGAATNSVADALTRLSLTLSVERASRDFVENYEWRVLPTEVAIDWFPAAVEDLRVTQIAARRLILSAMVEHGSQLAELDALDQLHAIAVENSIVTPFSSMIVLVNQRQQNLLDDLENAEDRFDREFEEIDDTQGLPVTGVPEPHEYLLMALAGGMLVWYLRDSRRRQAMSQPIA